MSFGIIGQAGPGMMQVVGFGDRSTGRGTFGANLRRAIVTNGDFTAYMCDSAATQPSSQITLGRVVIINDRPTTDRASSICVCNRSRIAAFVADFFRSSSSAIVLR